MKYLKLLLLLLCCQQLNSQDLPDINSLLSIQPKWSYLTEDTNWYRIQLDINLHLDQYSGSIYLDRMIKDNDYYLLQGANGQTHNPPLIEGYFLHKIDLNTGKPHWVHYDNFYSGNDFVETIFGGNMHFNNDGDIVLNGFKSLDSINNITFEGFDDRVYVNVMRDVVDDNNGHLLDHRVDLDTSRTIDKLHPGGFLLRKVGNNRQVKHIFENVFEDGFVRNYLHFYDVDEDGIVSDEPVFSFKHTTIVDFNAPILTYYNNAYFQINDNFGVALFGSIDQSMGNIPADLKLVFFDTSSSPDINVIEERDIFDLMPSNINPNTGLINLRGKDQHFFVGQKVRVQIDSITQEQYIWLQWYDNAGVPIQKIDRLQINGLDIDFISDYTFVGDTMYMLCRKTEGGPLGEDIYFLIRSDKDTDIEILSSFTKPNQFNDFSINFSGLSILEDGDVIFNLFINYPYDGFVKKNATFLCRYDGHDFGLPTSVEEETLHTMSLSPNPATHTIKLSSDGDYEIRNISVIDILGNSKVLHIDKSRELDISALPSGTYYVRFFQNGVRHVMPFVKI